MTTAEYIVGIKDKDLQKFEIEEAIASATRKQTSDKYTYRVLDIAARRFSDDICRTINEMAQKIDCPPMPYKAQYLLEKVIRNLEERV